MKSQIVSHDEAKAIWQNVRWFCNYYFKAKKLSDGRYRVTTNYPWTFST